MTPAEPKAIAKRNLEILTNAIRKCLESRTDEVKWADREYGQQMVQVVFIDHSSVILPYADFNRIALTANYKKRTLGNQVVI